MYSTPSEPLSGLPSILVTTFTNESSFKDGTVIKKKGRQYFVNVIVFVSWIILLIFVFVVIYELFPVLKVI